MLKEGNDHAIETADTHRPAKKKGVASDRPKHIEGAQVSFNEDGTFHSMNDAVLIQYLTETAAAAQGTGPVPYIRGGSAGVIKS